MKELILPANGDNTQTIQSVGNFVIVGANGSGKTRLGAWIESLNEKNVLRISAQRALAIPDIVTLKSEETSWNKIFYGSETQRNKIHKWGCNDAYREVSDIEAVLSAIIAHINSENDAYVASCRTAEINHQEKPRVPMMIWDKFLSIWDSVFPHRKIDLKDAKVTAIVGDNIRYDGQKMSDGERVAIYLICQCLLAPDGTTIIIDEPEIHLHRSIMYRLWNHLEKYCTAKALVYIIHDLDFAASRKESVKIWVKSYNGSNLWEITPLPSSETIPDDLMMEVLGNRKPVLFVEGERGSYDNQLYPAIYEEFTVIPSHSCRNVIELTKAFNEESIRTLHNYKVCGLIDRDYMTEEEIQSYREHGIYTLDVAEVENLNLAEDVVRIIAENQGLNPDEIFEQVKNQLFEAFQQEYDNQLVSICTKEIHHKLNCYTKPSENTLEALKTQMTNLCDSIDVDTTYTNTNTRLRRIIEEKDYNELLKVYNRKSLHRRVSSLFHLASNDYPNLVLRLMKQGKRDEILNAFKAYTPTIS